MWQHIRNGGGIQINLPAIYSNVLPPSYRAWVALFTVAKTQVIHA